MAQNIDAGFVESIDVGFKMDAGRRLIERIAHRREQLDAVFKQGQMVALLPA